MQAMEMVRKAGFLKKMYGLTITVAPESQDHMLQEFRHVKEALVNWKKNRGASCETVMFTMASDVSLHPFLKDLLAKVYEGEQDLSPILKSVNVLVGLLDKSGQPKEEYALGEP
jgi:hypothetical protein